MRDQDKGPKKCFEIVVLAGLKYAVQLCRLFGIEMVF